MIKINSREDFEDLISAIEFGEDVSEYDPEDVEDALSEIKEANNYHAVVGWNWDNR